jgi:hypothetical protein
LVVGLICAVGFKALPVYFGNRELINACEFIASGASKKPIETLEREVKDRARELGVMEVLTDRKALRITKTGGEEAGTCTIILRYQQTIDFYGAYQWTLVTDKHISKPIYENIS